MPVRIGIQPVDIATDEDLKAVWAELSMLRSDVGNQITDVAAALSAQTAAATGNLSSRLDSIAGAASGHYTGEAHHTHEPAPPDLPDTTPVLTPTRFALVTSNREIGMRVMLGYHEPLSISGDIYLQHDDGPFTQVHFYIDDEWHRTEGVAPFDLNGGTPTAPSPFDTTTLTNGVHTFSSRAQASGVPDELTIVEFIVDNQADPIPEPPSDIPPSDVASPPVINLPTTGFVRVPMDATASWFSQQAVRTFVFDPVTYPNIVNIQPRPFDKFYGATRVKHGDKFAVALDGETVTDYVRDMDHGTTILTRPGNAVGPAIIGGVEGVIVIGLEVVGYDPGNSSNWHTQSAMIGGNGGFRNGKILHCIARDAPDGYGFKLAQGCELSWFVASDNFGEGFGGVMGGGIMPINKPDVHVHHGAALRNGKHNGAEWEAGNKPVIGTILIEHVYAEGNAMAGIWLDIHVHGRAIHNWFVRNGMNGIKFEISGGIDIAWNVLDYNGQRAVPGVASPQGDPYYYGGWPCWMAQVQIQNSGRIDDHEFPIVVRGNLMRFGGESENQCGLGLIHQGIRNEFGHTHALGNVDAFDNRLEMKPGRATDYHFGHNAGGTPVGDNIISRSQFRAKNTIVAV